MKNGVYCMMKGGVDMPASKAQMKATNKYNASKYDSLRIVIPKGQKEAVDAHARSKGLSTNGLVNELLRADMGVSEADWKSKSADALEE